MASTTLKAGATSASNGVVFTGLGGTAPTNTASSDSTTKKNSARAALDLGRNYGLAMVFGGLFAGFALVM